MTRSLTTLLFICLSVLPLALSPDVHSGEIAPTQGTPGNQHESQSGGSRPDAQAAAFESSFLLYSISDSLDDGTEAQGTWYPKGYEYDLDRVGTESSGERFIAAFRFKVPDLVQGEQVAFARLRLPSREQISHGTLHLVVGGVDEDSPEPCSQVRLPSQIPETDEAVPWHVRALPRSVSRFFYQTSPNLAPVLNEILARPGWSRAGKALILVVEPDTTSRQASGYIGLQDCVDNTRRRTPAMLEIYPTVEDALVGKPVLGRPTDTSVTINLLSLIDLDVYVRYGTAPGDYAFSTKTKSGQAGGEAIEIELTGLMPNATYFYRVFYRPSGEGDFRTAPEAGFHTQRSSGSAFAFTIQADSHFGLDLPNATGRRTRLYKRTLANVLADSPDFHIDLGDFSRVELAVRRSAESLSEATERYLSQRYYLEKISASVPFYLVLGNHEGEQGWRLSMPYDSLAIWGTRARKQVIPNPYPDKFYTGNTDMTPCCGLRGDYYAWQWGDALFVVLDPFWYTVTRPHNVGGRLKPSMDGWDWTLGEAQYNWLYRTLHESKAKWKFVFAHQMTGGVTTEKKSEGPYGRGGIDGARYRVAHHATYEWGGEDSTGNYVFEDKRPGWKHGPIHEMMMKEGVDIFFRGHDHVFVYETLDGIVYQTCPAPNDRRYSQGFFAPALFSTGIEVNNSGHLRVTVSPDSVKVDYVRAVLPDDDPLSEGGGVVHNGDVSYSYTLKKQRGR